MIECIKYQVWDKNSTESQLMKVAEEIDEFIKEDDIVKKALEALDIATAAYGLFSVFCRENGLNEEHIKDWHFKKDNIRGYIEN